MYFFDVYNYKIGDLVIDEFRLYFINDQIYKFKYLKSVAKTDIDIENKGANLVYDYYLKYISVIHEIYNGLKSKYGYPVNTQLSNNDSLVSFYSTSKNCNYFDVVWNKETADNISDSELSIHLGNSFCKWKNNQYGAREVTDYSYNQNVTVYFEDKNLNKYISQQFHLKNLNENSKIDSIRKRRKKIIDDL